MELSSAARREAGIWETQVGDPLAHRQQGVRDCASAQRLAGFAGFSAQAQGEDEQVAELDFRVLHGGERWAKTEGATEVGPITEDLVSGFGSFARVGFRGDLMSKAEVSLEDISGER